MKKTLFKKGFKKKLFSVVLALAMVVTLMPMNSLQVYATAPSSEERCDGYDNDPSTPCSYYDNPSGYDEYRCRWLCKGHSGMCFLTISHSEKSSCEYCGWVKHTHTWNYTADGATLTAKSTCHNDAACGYKADGEKTVSLTLTASSANYSGITGLDDFNAATGLDVKTTDVKCYKTTIKDAVTGGNEFGIPSSPGFYYSSLTVNVSGNEYVIKKAFQVGTPTHKVLSISSSGDKMTATCDQGCGEATPHTATVAIITDSNLNYSSVDGVDTFENLTGKPLTIEFYKSNIMGITKDGEKIEGIPSEPGYYYVTVTVNYDDTDYIAAKAFAINKAADPTPCEPEPAPASTPSSSSSNDKVEEIVIEPVTVKLDIKTVNIEGVQLNSWTAIETSLPTLTSDKLSKANGDTSNVLQVNISTKTDKTVPASTVQALAKSPATGMHVFIGNNDAITFVKGVDYSKYAGVSFTHFDTITDNSRVIDFLSKVSLNAPVMFHTVVPANKNIAVYKVVAGQEVLVTNAVSTELGRVCFVIDSTAKYVLKY